MDIGARLLALRQLKSLSQRELAKRAGVTNSAISMIETNRVSPSISSLEKILAAMAISLSEFFSPQTSDTLDYQVVYKNRDLLDISYDDVEKLLVGKYFLKERAMSMTVQTYPIARESSFNESSQVGEKAGYLVKGEMALILKGKEYALVAGDSFYFESHLAHRLINKGQSEAILLSVSSPIEE